MDAASRATISARMADFAAGLRYEDLPQDVRDLAHFVLLDTLGCALAGSTTDEVVKIREAMSAAGGGAGDTILWGTSSERQRDSRSMRRTSRASSGRSAKSRRRTTCGHWMN